MAVARAIGSERHVVPVMDLRKQLHADLEAYLGLLEAQVAEGEMTLRLRLRGGRLMPGWTVKPPRPARGRR